MFFKSSSQCAAALAVLLHHSAAADTVTLVNGDTLSGTVASQQDGLVVLEHAQLGRVELPAGHVAAVSIDPLPQDGQTPPNGGPVVSQEAETESEQPSAEPALVPGAPDNPEPVTDAAMQDAAAQEQASLYNIFIDEWETKLTLGFTGTSGNTDRQNYHVKLDTEYEKKDTRWTFNSGFFYATANARRTQNEIQTRITRDWLQEGRPWFFFLRGEHEYDQFRTWENRASGFGGAGYTLIDKNDFKINTRMGFGGTYEFGQINDFTPEALFGGSVAKWKITPRQTLSGEATYYPSLEDDSDFRVQTKLEWLYKLDVGTGLSLKLGVQNEYESLTPGDKANNDVKYYGALVLSF